MANIKELKRVRAHLRRFPELHDQGSWFEPGENRRGHLCGTKACVAGRVLLLNGWRYDSARNTLVDQNGDDVHAHGRKGFGPVAREILGITWDESYRLFFYRNTTVDEDLTALIEGRPLVKAAW